MPALDPAHPGSLWSHHLHDQLVPAQNLVFKLSLLVWVRSAQLYRVHSGHDKLHSGHNKLVCMRSTSSSPGLPSLSARLSFSSELPICSTPRSVSRQS